nr:DUF418 domain-containing protein [Pleionea sp. CnH1-48]
MALYKSGFIKQVYSTRTYLLVAMVSLALGYWLTWEGVLFNEHHEFSWKYSLAWGTQFNYWGSLFVALGYLSLILVWGKNIDASLIKRSLSSVGKMAFTNYLMQSIICASLLWGTGFALFGQLDRFEQLLWVLGIWVVCIGFSVAWLKRFEYGPAEWVWRCLTYGKLFPLIRQDK